MDARGTVTMVTIATTIAIRLGTLRINTGTWLWFSHLYRVVAILLV